MTTKLTLIAASAVLALSTVTSAHAAVTFYEAYVEANAAAEAENGTFTSPSYNNGYDEADSFTTMPLNAEAYATHTVVTQGVVQAAATDDEVVTASFSSPSSGSFDFTGATSATVNVASGSAIAYDNGTYVVYDFDVSAPTNFNLSYAITGGSSLDYDSDSEYYLYNSSSGTEVGYHDNLDNTSGSVSYVLNPGFYDFEVVDYSNQDYVSQSGIGLQTGSHDDNYSFSVSGAPEPSAWALMIVGVGLVGSALRYGRRNATGLAGA